MYFKENYMIDMRQVIRYLFLSPFKESCNICDGVQSKYVFFITIKTSLKLFNRRLFMQ